MSLQQGEQNPDVPDFFVIDKSWYEKFKAIPAASEITLLTGSKEKSEDERAKFLSSDTGNPSFDYPNIKIAGLNSSEAKLLALKAELLATEQNEVVQKAYVWKINECIASIRMVRITKEIEELVAADPNMGNPILKQKLHRFQKYTEYVHGKPSKDIFAFSVNSLRSTVVESIQTMDVDYQKIADEFLGMVPEWTEPYQKPESASPELQQKVLDVTRAEIGNIVHIDNPQNEYTSEDVKPIFEDVLRSMGAEGWTVMLHPVQRFMNINQTKKEVRIPAVISLPYTHERLEALIAHELGTHVQRRLNGDRSKFLLLSTGFDRYSAGEEGVATVREQAISGDFSADRWLERHVAIGMTLGLDGTKRDFREIFEVMWRYYYLDLRKGGMRHEDALSKARNKSYDRCVRTFRGTDGGSTGYCYTKDIGYAEGNIGVWELVGENPDEMMRFSVGKYDPTNARHIWILSQLGITDTDLKDLEKGNNGIEKSE